MALIVEDGTGLSTADSYISQADATTYFTNHGAPSAWTDADSDTKDSALRYATAWIDGKYRWIGEIVSSSQALGWPRYDAEDGEGRLLAATIVPQKVKDAVCEAALLHLTSALNSTYDRGGEIIREKVGPIETEYRSGAAVETQAPHIGRLLRNLTVGGGAMARIELG